MRPLNGLWHRAKRHSFVRGRLTRRRLDAFMATQATEARALVIHSRDIDYRRHFPNAKRISSKPEPTDEPADPHYTILAELPARSEDLIVCTGLLEHLPDPHASVAEMARILRPGGRLILSASAVFSFHGGRDNYYHFTPAGLESVLGDDLDLVEMRGSTGPFETLGVLAQRIALQCDVFPPVRPFLDLLTVTLPLLDRAVSRQYDNMAKLEPVDPAVGVMPAALIVVARKV
ncbi:MAG: class I SAM-dependent methyltransferase [Rhodobacteraceae bacterium]|nr:class I SAM-dependent methyltransferase [Paracoccaceae bacterium]